MIGFAKYISLFVILMGSVAWGTPMQQAQDHHEEFNRILFEALGSEGLNCGPHLVAMESENTMSVTSANVQDGQNFSAEMYSGTLYSSTSLSFDKGESASATAKIGIYADGKRFELVMAFSGTVTGDSLALEGEPSFSLHRDGAFLANCL